MCERIKELHLTFSTLTLTIFDFSMRKRKRDVKPITDPSQEGIAAQQSGLKKENSFESGSHSA